MSENIQGATADGLVIRPVYFTFEPPQPPPEWLDKYGECLSVPDVAEITGVSAQTIRSELEAGNIPGTRIGRQWVIPKPLLISFLTGRLGGEK